MDLSVQLAPRHPKGLRLSNPVMVASGTFGYGEEYASFIDIQKLGAIICKGTTLKARPGNPQPRLAETASGLLNSIGLQNPGLQAVIAHKAPLWATWKVPVLVNIAGETVEDYGQLAALLEGVAGVAGLEVNIGCPNVAIGGMEFGADPLLAAAVTAMVKKATTLPVMVKLTPNVTDIVAVARAVEGAGADAISLINTLVGMVIDITKRRPLLGNLFGGLSGPAIKPVALAQVYKVAGAVGVPVVGCGGIVTASDALEFLMAGATAVQVGTATFLRPGAALEVLEGIEGFMARGGIGRIGEVVGTARV